MLHLENRLRSKFSAELDIFKVILRKVSIKVLQPAYCVKSSVPVLVPHSQFRDQHPTHRSSSSSRICICQRNITCPDLSHMRNDFHQILYQCLSCFKSRHSRKFSDTCLILDSFDIVKIERNITEERCKYIIVERTEDLTFAEIIDLILVCKRRSFNTGNRSSDITDSHISVLPYSVTASRVSRVDFKRGILLLASVSGCKVSRTLNSDHELESVDESHRIICRIQTCTYLRCVLIEILRRHYCRCILIQAGGHNECCNEHHHQSVYIFHHLPPPSI